MHFIGAPLEGIHHRIGDLAEKRLEHLAERAAGELVLERKIDRARLRRQRAEAPCGVEAPERAFEEAHVDSLGGTVLVQRGEGLAQAAQARGQRGALFPVERFHVRVDAPGQKARIGLDIVDERVHLLRAVLDDRRSGDSLHPLKCFMSIVDNRKAFHDYFIEERYEAGLALQGWEVKAIRAGRAQIAEAYVMVRGAELYLIGAHVSPLPTVSTHYVPDPTRTRKLLMHAEEIKRLVGKVEQRGYSLIPLNLHYAKSRIKLEMALARGKLKHDKRADEREREWNREKQRLLRSR